MVLKIKNANLFEQLVAHQELLSSTRDISITVLKSHTGESGLLNLDGHCLSKIKSELSLLTWMNSRVHGSREYVKTLVSYFINHFILY